MTKLPLYVLYVFLLTTSIIIAIVAFWVLMKWTLYFNAVLVVLSAMYVAKMFELLKDLHSPPPQRGYIPIAKIDLFNNSGEDFNCSLSCTEECLKNRHHLIALVTQGNAVVFFLTSQNTVKNIYNFISLRSESLPGVGMYLQIQPDMKIYLLNDDNFPATVIPPQPDGFPLVPQVK